MNKIYKNISYFLIASFCTSSITGCGILYNTKTGIKIEDKELERSLNSSSVTGSAMMYYGNSFALYSNRSGLFVLTEPGREHFQDLYGVNIEFNKICREFCDELLKEIDAKPVNYNKSGNAYAGNRKVFHIINDETYLVFSTPKVDEKNGRVEIEYVNNKDILTKQINDYNNAKTINTVDSYKKFIDENSDNIWLVEKANNDIERLQPDKTNETLRNLAIAGAGLYGLGKIVGHGIKSVAAWAYSGTPSSGIAGGGESSGKSGKQFKCEYSCYWSGNIVYSGGETKKKDITSFTAESKYDAERAIEKSLKDSKYCLGEQTSSGLSLTPRAVCKEK